MRAAKNESHFLSFELSQGTVGVIVQKQGPKGQMSVRPSVGMTVTADDKKFLLEYLRSIEGHQFINPRVGLLAKVAEWLVEAPNNHVLTNLDKEISPTRGNGQAHPNSPGRRLVTITSPSCGCGSGGAACPFFPMASDTAAIGCPTTPSSVAEVDEGTTCLPDYTRGYVTSANYKKDTDGTVWVWNRKYGSASTECRGRCGMGCNFLDKEAFKDCFDHDSCVDHLGGTSIGGDNCGIEFDHAADDYIASYGWFCPS